MLKPHSCQGALRTYEIIETPAFSARWQRSTVSCMFSLIRILFETLNSGSGMRFLTLRTISCTSCGFLSRGKNIDLHECDQRNGGRYGITAPAHPHATSVAAYPALFKFLEPRQTWEGNIRNHLGWPIFEGSHSWDQLHRKMDKQFQRPWRVHIRPSPQTELLTADRYRYPWWNRYHELRSKKNEFNQSEVKINRLFFLP